MHRHLASIAILIDDYDVAIAYYTNELGFTLLEDTELGGGKRWVRVAPGAQAQTSLLLARASDDQQRARIGDQCAGRVFLFLHTPSFDEEFERLTAKGVPFESPPRSEPYGKVAVFRDRYGHRWDLVEPKLA